MSNSKKKKKSNLDILSKILGIDLGYFLKGGFWLGLFQVSNLGKAFILSILFANLVSAEFYGKYNFILTFISFVGIFAMPGLLSSIVQAVAVKYDGTFNKALKIMLLTSMLGSMVLFIMSFYYYNVSDIEMSSIFLLLGILFPLYQCSLNYGEYYYGKREFKKRAIIGSLSNIFTFFSVFVILIVTKNLFLIILSILLVRILFEGYYTYKLFKLTRQKKVLNKSIKHGIRTSFLQAPAMGVLRLENILIGFSQGFAQLAIFVIITLIPNQAKNFLNILVPTFLPKLVKESKKITKYHLFKQFIKLEVMYVLIICVYFFASYYIFYYFYPAYQNYYLLSNLFALTLISVPYLIIEKYFRAKLLTKKVNILNLVIFLSMVLIVFPNIFLYGLKEIVYAKILQHTIIITTSVILLLSPE